MNPLKAAKQLIAGELDRHKVYRIPSSFRVDSVKEGYGNTIIVETKLSPIYRGAKPRKVEFALEVSQEQRDELFYQVEAREMAANRLRVIGVKKRLEAEKRKSVASKTGLNKIFATAAFNEEPRQDMPIVISLDGGEQLVRGGDLNQNNALGTRKVGALMAILSDYSGANMMEIIELAEKDVAKGQQILRNETHRNHRMQFPKLTIS